MTDTSETAPAAVTPGQAAYERWHIFQRRRFPGIAPILWGELGAEAQAEWENIAQDAIETAESHSTIYLYEIGRLATALRTIRDAHAPGEPGFDVARQTLDDASRVIGVRPVPQDDGETPGYWQVRTALTAATHALQLAQFGTDDNLAALARETLAKVDEIMNGDDAADSLIRDILESLCRRDELPLESAVAPGEAARNYELADRLGIGTCPRTPQGLVFHLFELPPPKEDGDHA